MTISSQEPISPRFKGNGVTTIFTYTFDASSSAEIVVKKREVDGDEVVLSNPGDYTVNTSTKQVTVSVAPADGEVLTIERVDDIEFPETLNRTTGWIPSDHQGYLERLTKRVQEARSLIKRSLIGRSTSGMHDYPNARPSMVCIDEVNLQSGLPVMPLQFSVPLRFREFNGLRVEFAGLEVDTDDSQPYLELRQQGTNLWTGNGLTVGYSLWGQRANNSEYENGLANVIPLSLAQGSSPTKAVGFNGTNGIPRLDGYVDFYRTLGDNATLPQMWAHSELFYQAPSTNGSVWLKGSYILSGATASDEWDGIRVALAAPRRFNEGTVRLYARVA